MAPSDSIVLSPGCDKSDALESSSLQSKSELISFVHATERRKEQLSALRSDFWLAEK